MKEKRKNNRNSQYLQSKSRRRRFEKVRTLTFRITHSMSVKSVETMIASSVDHSTFDRCFTETAYIYSDRV